MCSATEHKVYREERKKIKKGKKVCREGKKICKSVNKVRKKKKDLKNSYSAKEINRQQFFYIKIHFMKTVPLSPYPIGNHLSDKARGGDRTSAQGGFIGKGDIELLNFVGK